jgi:hypothetical protein
MQPLENLLQREKGINLAKYIQPPSGVSWKSAVPVEWLCKHQELFMDYINISKNTIISGKKHKLALEKLHHQYDILGGRKSTQDAVDYVDDTIRMALSHLRQMCQVPQKKDLVYRKCSPAMQAVLEKLLVKIDFGQQESCTDLVPYDGDARGDDQGRGRPSLSRAGSSRDDLGASGGNALASGPNRNSEVEIGEDVKLRIFGEKPESVFDRILSKKPSDPTTPKKKLTQEKKEKTPSPGDPFVCSLERLPGDDDLLKKAAEVQPLARGGKSQQQRLNSAKKMKRPAASKPGKEEKKCKKQKTLDHTQGEDKEDECPPQNAKRPAASTKMQKTKKNDSKKKGKKKMGPPSDQLDPSKPADRALLRRRADSDAWHNTFKQEFAKNEDEDKSKELARAAARKAREEFDRKHPKQPATSKAKAKASPEPKAKAKAKGKTKNKEKEITPAEDINVQPPDVSQEKTSTTGPQDID